MHYRNTNNKQESEARMTRGLQILESKTIKENRDGSFVVPSQTSSTIYEVRLLGQTWACTCPDFEYRPVEACKHIFAVKMFIAANTYLKNQPKPKVLADDAVTCKKCGSIRVIRYGVDCGKQSYSCKDCKARFVQDSLLKKAKFNPELVTLCLDLYFSGLSLRKIARNLSDHFHVDINYSTIYTWIQKYIPMIAYYVNALTPELSKEWHADELFVKTKGGSNYKGTKGMGFLWNVMDRQTRYLIASKLTEYRDTNAAVTAFQEAVKNAHDCDPEIVYTDALRAYRQGVTEFFPNKNIKHVESCGVNKRENNNRIERMNGTLRERTKVQRGWKKMETPLAEGNRIQYNFVKPHMALEGKTPAQQAGLQPKGWKELLELAIKATEKSTRGKNKG